MKDKLILSLIIYLILMALINAAARFYNSNALTMVSVLISCAFFVYVFYEYILKNKSSAVQDKFKRVVKIALKIILAIVCLIGFVVLMVWAGSALVEIYPMTSDMNGDGVYTIRDVWSAMGYVYCFPANAFYAVIVKYAPELAVFLEITRDSMSGFISAILSTFFYIAVLGVIGESAE